MRRIIIYLLIGVLISGLIGCENTKTPSSNSATSNSSHIKPIVMSEYTPYICLSGTTEKDVIRLLDEYSELYTINPISYQFSYVKVENSDNKFIIKCPQNLDFFSYHNIVGWFEESETYGVMLCNDNPNESYYCYVDKSNSFGDTLIGYFENQRELSIEIPAILEETGNLLVGKKDTNAKGLESFLKDNFFKLKEIESFEQMSPKTKTIEIGE